MAPLPGRRYRPSPTNCIRDDRGVVQWVESLETSALGPETEGGPAALTGRGPIWLPLLEHLTASVPEWVVLKNLDSAFDGHGDVDTMAPPRTWPAIERAFRDWADDAGLSVVGVCRHNRRGPNMLARREGDPYLYILDVKVMRPWRFSRFVTAEDALAFAILDAAGYRRARTGLGATLKLLFNGTAYGGRADEAAMRVKHVREELRADPEGALRAARLVGAAAPALRRGIRAAMDDGWSRRDMLAVEVWCAARGLREPVGLVRQIRGRRTHADRCPSLRLSYRDDRRLPDDTNAWVTAFVTAHPDTSFLGIHDRAA